MWNFIYVNQNARSLAHQISNDDKEYRWRHLIEERFNHKPLFPEKLDALSTLHNIYTLPVEQRFNELCKLYNDLGHPPSKIHLFKGDLNTSKIDFVTSLPFDEFMRLAANELRTGEKELFADCKWITIPEE